MAILGSIIKRAITFRGRIPQRRSSYKRQVRELRKLLLKAQNTAFGQEYKFDKLLLEVDPIKAYQNTVPVFDYEGMYNNWWQRSLKGEAYISWPGRIKYFALSSGTSESASKHIPVTKEMIKSIQRGTLKQILSTVHYKLPKEIYEKRILMVGGSTNLNYNGKYYSGDLSGITTGTQPKWFQNFTLPGPKIRSKSNWEDKLHDIVVNAKSWDVGFICGVPAWIQILFERIIEHYNVKTVHEVWPNLRIFVHGGVAVMPYKKSLEKLTAFPLIYCDTYMASEGFFAYQERPNEHQAMKLMYDNKVFFEFIQFNENNFDPEGNLNPNHTALNISEVELDKEYAIIITNCAGAWRYILGDTIKFTDLRRCEVVVTGRIKHFLSMCGEHLSVDNMTRAVKLSADDLGIEINEFCVAGIPYENLFAHHWYVGVNKDTDKKALKEKIDQHLKNLNDDYKVERTAALKEVIVTVLPDEVFIDFLAAKNKLGSQNKFPRVLKGKIHDEWLTFLETNKKHCS
jgi:hypothetical protein